MAFKISGDGKPIEHIVEREGWEIADAELSSMLEQ